MKADKIKIQNLEVFANHGVFPEENVLGQKFVVSAVLYTDTRKAGQTDELTASIHYGEVSAFIDRYLKEHTFQLLEKVAESLAEELLLQTKGLQKIRLEIKNPGHRSVCRWRRSAWRLKENGIRHILHLDPISGTVKLI